MPWRSSKKSGVPETDVNDSPRPPQPNRYKASKDELVRKGLGLVRPDEVIVPLN